MNAPSASSTHQEPTYIDILLDETGSMASCHAATVSGFNEFIAEQKTIEGSCYLTLTKFDSSGIKTPYVNLALDLVPNLSFHPGATTNLYDVVGKRVRDLLAQNRNGRSLVVIITDGEDNASREFNVHSVKAMVEDALSRGVSFLYFGAGSRAEQIGRAMGIPASAIRVFDTARMGETMAVMSAQTRAFRAS